MTLSPLISGVFYSCTSSRSSMSTTFDFTLVSSGVPGMSLVMAMNEEAFETITGEFDMTCIKGGGAPLDNARLSDFVHLAERAHLACDFS